MGLSLRKLEEVVFSIHYTASCWRCSVTSTSWVMFTLLPSYSGSNPRGLLETCVWCPIPSPLYGSSRMNFLDPAELESCDPCGVVLPLFPAFVPLPLHRLTRYTIFGNDTDITDTGPSHWTHITYGIVDQVRSSSRPEPALIREIRRPMDTTITLRMSQFCKFYN
jgi:hypothetical protein